MTTPDPALRIVGQRLPRAEASQKVTGDVRYVADLARPGMLHGVLVRSQVPAGRVRGVDASAALAAAGVVAVISSANLAERFPDLPSFDPACKGLDRPADRRVLPGDVRLFDERVRFVGEPIALIVAETERAAREAVGLVEIDIESLPAVLDIDAARASGAPLVHDDAPGNVLTRLDRGTGDVDAAFADAALVIERTFTTARQKQAQLEPTGGIAEWDADGRLTVWSPCQAPHRARFTLAGLFGLPLTDVRVIVPTIGGAFGKGDALTVEPYAAVAAAWTGRPVRIVLTRSEDFVGTEARHATRTTLAAAFRPDGTIAGLRGRTLIDGGAYVTHSPAITGVLLTQLVGSYRIDAADVQAEVLFTNTPVAGAFRGYGGPQAAFPLETLIDRGCRQLGADPLEARDRMRLRRDDLWGPLQVPLQTDISGDVLRRGAEAIGWAERRAIAPTGPLRRGVGMAAVVWKSGVYGKGTDVSGATIEVLHDGSVRLASGATDLGTGIRTTLVQICAEVLSLPMDAIRLAPSDTDLTPFDMGAFASRSLYRAGQAVLAASEAARAVILAHAATRLEIAAADLDLIDGRIVARGVPGRSIALADLARDVVRDGGRIRGEGDAPRTNAPTFSAQFADVEVDLESGVVRVLRIVAVADVGRAINPAIVEGQIQGAAHQGLGYALSEGLVLDPETGTLLNGSFMDYWLLTSADSPTIDVILLEEPDPTGPFGAKGIAEPGIVVTAPAIANAILHATGAELTDLPMTPERVLAALDALDALGEPSLT